MNKRIVSWIRLLCVLSFVLVLRPAAQAQTSVTSGGWFIRGTGTNFTDYSMVIPLSGQQGILNGPSLSTTYTNLGFTNLYHVNATNTGSQNVMTNRFAISNAVVAFGSRYGGSPLYFNQNYNFGVYAGDFTQIALTNIGGYYYLNPTIMVSAVNRTNGSWVGTNFFQMYVPLETTAWGEFLVSGMTLTYTNFLPGLNLNVYSDFGEPEWGVSGLGPMTVTLTANTNSPNTNAANCEYTFWATGVTGTNYVVMTNNGGSYWYSPLFTVDFDPQPPLLPNFVSQPQFSGQLLPPFYLGASQTELLAVKAVVTNTVNPSATNYLDLDDSPELRDHPTLDQFVTAMGSNALALTAYVFNQIELTDAIAYNSNTNNLLDTSINLGGINRSAYDTYMEGQGSPTEQCALLVYLLRRAGVPAAYIFGPTDGIQMLDSQLSSLLRMQIHGIVNQNNGQVYTTNTLISVNYPWVAAYINGQWIHLFPWLKNTEVTEGLNLFDYMPVGYNSDVLWLNHYLSGDTNIYGLSTESDVPSTLFPLFLQQALLTNAPGVSLDDIGTAAINRQVEFNQWSDFPTPFAVTNGSVTTVDNLTTITTNSGFSTWTNIWDTISILVQSSVHTNNYLYTGDLRMADLQDRKFLIRQQTNGPTSPLTLTLTLSLAPYRPTTSTNVTAFTNDSTLTNQQILQMTLTNTDNPINVTFTRKRHRTEPAGVTNVNYWASYGGVSEDLLITSSTSLQLGDLAAICLHSGRVSQQMLTPWAQEYWTMQQEVAINPSLTNTLSPDITQGTLPYLMGMSYYERLSRFGQQLAYLHKVQLGTLVAQGLSILGAEHTNTTGALMTPINLYHPHVDMFYNVVSSFGNESLQPDTGTEQNAATDGFLRLFVAEGSAQEHKITEDFYSQTNGISTVHLLLQAQQLNPTNLVVLDIGNFTAYSNALAHWDTNIWAAVVNAFTSPTNAIAEVLITANPVTNTTVGYQGMGALIYAPPNYLALISGNGLPANGGWGEPLDVPIYDPPSFANISLSFDTSSDNNWSVTYSTPTPSAPIQLSETVSYWTQPTTYSDLSTGAITFGNSDVVQQNAFDVAIFALGYTGSTAAANAYEDAVNNGGDYQIHIGPNYAQLAGTVADPVNVVTGEFYINANDLTLPGPMPLFVQRNYSSQDVDLGDTPFGYGWRPAYTPYLRLVTNGLIYAAELDGTIVAYRQPTPGTNYWMPFPSDNPQLNNRSSTGIGSTANLFNNYITTNVTSGNTNYVLNGVDGSVRLFQYLSFPIPTTNDFVRARPYLQTWTDARGNSYGFTYQTDNTQPDYGQLLRVQSSNGNFFGFYYDVFAHITQAYTGDGRFLTYDYDSHGDLVTVTLPDESQINYVYEHTNSVTNGVTNVYSTHLISQVQEPNGRTTANTYDNLRRVILQAATVGDDLNLVTNATFVYSNTFTNLTNSVISGTTYVTNVFGKLTTYQYSNNLITNIVDALGNTETQVWFSNTNDTGYYPHSLKFRTDKRGLNTAYQYDTNGNVAQIILTGNLTGGTSTNETATYTSTYTSRNLLSTWTDPANNETTYYYTNTAYPMLATAVVKSANGTPTITNQYFYTNVIQTVTNGAVVATNSAYGLLQETIRGGSATNVSAYNGQGFLTQSTRYTGTGDPAVTMTLLYSERGELVQKTDALGRSAVYAYDPMGRPTETEVYESGASTPEGYHFSYYNENGDLVWTQGSRYNPVDYVWRDYDGAGRKITEMRWRSEANTNGSGVEAPSATTNLYSTTFYQYDAFNNLIQVTDPLGNYTLKQYDAIGQLTNEAAYSAAGTPMATNRYNHEPGGLVSSITNALGGVTTKTYTSRGKLMFQSNPDGSTNGWQYYLDGRLNKEFLPNGNYWQTTYNDAQLTVTKIFYNSGGPLATNVAVMDTRGNVIQKTDADGFVYTNFFDGLDRLKVAAGPATTNIFVPGMMPGGTNFQTNIAQQVATYYYDSAGETLTTSNALGEATVTTSDALGRPTQVAIYNSNSVTPVRVASTSYSADHQSVTVTNGTGSTAIITTTYTDNDGHPVLTIASPTNGVSEFTWWKYDLAGNRIAQQQCSSNGTFTVWTTNGWTYDGLNRVATETTRDGATTTYSYDALGDVTNRAMPAGLTWSATYLNDGRISAEQESGGSLTARSMSYTYYGSGNPFAGCLELVTDGRSTTRSNSYDDFFRLANVTTTGSTPQQQTLTTYQYDPRCSLTSLSQSFATNTTGFPTTVNRGYDGYGRIAAEQTLLNGSQTANMTQGWDQTGRRTALNGTQFGYQADGKLVTVVNNSGTSTFGYGNNGLLTGRTNANRIYSINQRDGRGRVLQTTTTIVGTMATALTENLAWRNDGRLSSYSAARGDFTDSRNYSYSTLANRLTQESFDLTNSTPLTNTYTIDNGSTGGLGIVTSVAETGNGSASWSVPSSGGLDGLSRLAEAHNNIINRPANGEAYGAETVWATLDSKPVSVDYDTSEGGSTWRADLDLSSGSHTLLVSAVDSTGAYFGYATNTFTVTNTAYDVITNSYDGNGNVTVRAWVSAIGVTNRLETLTWDAFDRLIAVSNRDTTMSNGFNWVATYDGFGRRIYTGYTMVVSNVPIVDPPDAESVITSMYDPQIEFLETAVNVDGVTTMKTYGPDSSGVYGGMQGVGGLEAVRQAGFISATGVVQDFFGNIIGTITNATVSWNPARFSSYGPVPGYQSPALSLDTAVAQTLGWHGKRVDETGLICLGARHYDPVSQRFMSADPLGHSASQDLYSFCGGDPVNRFDPSGRYGKVFGDFGSYGTVFDANKEALFDEMFGQTISPYELAGDLEQLAGQAVMMPFGIVDSTLSQGYIAWNGTDYNGNAVSGWERGLAIVNTASLVLPLLPVGKIVGAGLEGISEFGMAEAGIVEGGMEVADVIGAGEEGLVDVAEVSEEVPTEIERGLGDSYADNILEGGTGNAFAGHGELRFGSGDTIVPQGTSITIWSEEGVGIQEGLGQAIETGDYSAIMNNPAYMSRVNGAATYLPGSSIPNYTLKAPDGLTIFRNSMTVEDATPLSTLLKPNMGNVNWAACTTLKY